MAPLLAAQKLIAEAIKTLGWSDQNNTVRTPIHTWYNAKFGNPDPGKYAWDWCDGSVTYWAWMSGNQAAVVFNGAYAYTVAHAQAFKDRGQWHTDVAGIAAGDIVFFDWDGSNSIGEIDHVGIVEYVNGAEVHTIEGNIENAVQRKVRTAATIVGYGRPNYAADPVTSPPPVTPPPVVVPPPVTNKPTVKLSDAIAHTSAVTKLIQDALNREFGGVVIDGDWGPQTGGAYKRWQQKLGWPGDGVPGADSLTKLGAKYGFNVDVNTVNPVPPVVVPPTTTPPTTGTPDVAQYLTVPEPAARYNRITYGGKTVNRRTADLLNLAAVWAGVTITLTQGSYNVGVAASAGTHDGGGVVDINVGAWSTAKRNAVVQALRKAGFAAWLRTPDDGFAYHIHACAIGDREMASLAKSQVQSYFNGRNGLANNGPTSGETHWPNWADKYNQ
jgi:peptidoglycan hydrolase-like protein with peptidoglycan-binding domain